MPPNYFSALIRLHRSASIGHFRLRHESIIKIILLIGILIRAIHTHIIRRTSLSFHFVGIFHDALSKEYFPRKVFLSLIVLNEQKVLEILANATEQPQSL